MIRDALLKKLTEVTGFTLKLPLIEVSLAFAESEKNEEESSSAVAVGFHLGEDDEDE